MGFESSDSWIILTPIEASIKRKIEQKGTPLKDWGLQINYGIKTGFNDAFIISGEKKDELIAADPKSAEIIRPILRGRDIKRYGYNFADLWVINAHNGIKSKGITAVDINAYPAIKNHLDLFFDKITKRADKGSTPYNLRNCAYLDDFSKPKIIYPETTQGAYFALDNGEMFADKTCFILLCDYPEYILATLSSSLFEYSYKRMFSSIELGENAYQYNKHAFMLLPVAHPDTIEKRFYQTIVGLAHQRILAKNEKEAQELDKNLEMIICSIYGLSEEEANFITNSSRH